MPAKRDSAEVKSVPLEVVEPARPTRRNPWRPTTLTLRKFVRICHLVEQGFAVSRACEVECISYSHFRFRVARSSRLEERLKQATDTRFERRHDEAFADEVESFFARLAGLYRCSPQAIRQHYASEITEIVN
jgi:hypothetical protein